MIRTLVVDDQTLVRSGFASILSDEPDIDVIGEAADGRQAVAACAELRPDVVLMDVRMPVMDGIEATRLITAHSATRVLVLTTFDADEHVYDAITAGASGFLLKDARPTDLIHAIRTVASGDALLAPTVTKRLIEDFVKRPPPGRRPTQITGLTDREVDVLKQIARGISNAEIAKELHLSETTIRTHVSRILSKLAIRDRVQAVVLAYESGLVIAGS